MIEFHKNTLKDALDTGRAMSIGVRELELKTNESVAKVEQLNRETTAIGEELYIKGSDSASNRAVNDSTIALNNKKIAQYDRDHAIAQADANIRLVESGKNLELIDARKKLVIRQVAGFDDNMDVKRSEHASNLYGMVASGGLEPPEGVLGKLL